MCSSDLERALDVVAGKAVVERNRRGVLFDQLGYGLVETAGPGFIVHFRFLCSGVGASLRQPENGKTAFRLLGDLSGFKTGGFQAAFGF